MCFIIPTLTSPTTSLDRPHVRWIKYHTHVSVSHFQTTNHIQQSHEHSDARQTARAIPGPKRGNERGRERNIGRYTETLKRSMHAVCMTVTNKNGLLSFLRAALCDVCTIAQLLD